MFNQPGEHYLSLDFDEQLVRLSDFVDQLERAEEGGGRRAYLAQHALFDQVLSHDGVLRNATRVLATNALQYLPRADCVVVVEDGRVAEMGTYDELMSKGLNFASLMAAHGIPYPGPLGRSWTTFRRA